MDLVENDVDTLHEEIEYLVGHLVRNDMNTLYEERNHVVRFNFIRVNDSFCTLHLQFSPLMSIIYLWIIYKTNMLYKAMKL